MMENHEIEVKGGESMLKKQLVAAIATGGLLLSTLVPAAFADFGDGVSIAGNGSFSSSSADFGFNNIQRINQNNSANFNNNVNVDNNTGNNSANFNTGGNNFINTGNATSTVAINNLANLNRANVGGFEDGFNGFGDPNVAIVGNGFGSFNNAGAFLFNRNSVFQNNNSNINNNVNVRNNTGNNTIFGNTAGCLGGWNNGWNGWNNGWNNNCWGNGTNAITTGNANSDVEITNGANANIAN